MFIFGRSHRTPRGFMLDEMKSLMQKTLRRKETCLALASLQELMAKDQLPWKSIWTFLFEDHALNDIGVLRDMYECLVVAGDKRMAVTTLLRQAGLCRIPACMAVVTINYKPSMWWIMDVVVDADLQGLVMPVPGRIDFATVMHHVRLGWLTKDEVMLAGAMKLASMVYDVDHGHATAKGEAMCLAKITAKSRKFSVPLLILSVLAHSADPEEVDRIRVCFDLLARAPAQFSSSLVLFETTAWHLFGDDATMPPPPPPPSPTECDSTTFLPPPPPLDHVPSWAVDKHTYRGRTGKCMMVGSDRVADEDEEELCGARQKVGIEHFFDEGCSLDGQSLTVVDNPYWEITKDMYRSRPSRLQKTRSMTTAYYTELKRDYPGVFHRTQKRSLEEYDGNDDDEVAWSKRIEHMPFLQVPRSSAKTYVRTDGKNVWKGPYLRPDTISRIIYRHRVMREVLGDPHTLPAVNAEEEEEGRPYVCFPLIKRNDGQPVRFQVIDFQDVIANEYVQGKMVVTPKSLGVIPAHRLSTVDHVPASLWTHFMFRYALNVGDSGLYNAIALDEPQPQRIYGLDMDENRGRSTKTHILDYMFAKRPRQTLDVEGSVKRLYQPIMASLDNAAAKVHVVHKMALDCGVPIPKHFLQRIDAMRTALDELVV